LKQFVANNLCAIFVIDQYLQVHNLFIIYFGLNVAG